MPALNFSSKLLERNAALVAVMELTEVLWSDWGKPERIVEALRILGIAPVPSLVQAAAGARS
jgi:mannose-1-phosphate guanylyltransferase